MDCIIIWLVKGIIITDTKKTGETTTLEYLITVHNGKLDFIWLAKKDNLMLNNQFKDF